MEVFYYFKKERPVGLLFYLVTKYGLQVCVCDSEFVLTPYIRRSSCSRVVIEMWGRPSHLYVFLAPLYSWSTWVLCTFLMFNGRYEIGTMFSEFFLWSIVNKMIYVICDINCYTLHEKFEVLHWIRRTRSKRSTIIVLLYLFGLDLSTPAKRHFGWLFEYQPLRTRSTR